MVIIERIERITKYIERNNEMADEAIESLEIMRSITNEMNGIIINCAENHKHDDGEMLCVWCKGELRRLCYCAKTENDKIKSLINNMPLFFAGKRKIKSASKNYDKFIQNLIGALYKE